MSVERRSDTGFMLAQTRRLVRETIWLALFAVIVLAVIDTLGDRLPGFDRVVGIPRLIASLAFQYGVTFKLLEREGLADRGARARFWALLGLSILSGVGILLGLALLVLPGLYLLVRWTVAVPVLIAERSGVVEALTRSGEEIEGRFWAVLAVCLVFWATFALATAVVIAIGKDSSVMLSIAANLILDAGLVGYWYAAVAIYIAGRPYGKVAEVFA
jgi:hypothetical protein